MIRIIVNKHNIKHNQNNKQKKKVLSIHVKQKTVYANDIKINGPCRIVYSPDKPIKCGATVWIETSSDYEIK